MSIPDRIVKLSKSYLGQVRERIDDAISERELAVRELAGDSAALSPPSRATDPDSLMRRAEEKIASARREMEASREIRPSADSTPTPATGAAPAVIDPHIAHFKILGVPPGSDYATVQTAYEQLANRLDANRFENATDKAEAGRILERVNAAYEALRSTLDPTQNRFGKLEL